MATAPSFIGTPRIGVALLSSAVTDVVAPWTSGSITSVLTGASTGTRVLEIDVQAAVETSNAAASNVAAIVNVFLTLDGGTNWYIYDQITLAAASGSNTVKESRNLATYANLVLPNASAQLGVTTTIAQNTVVTVLAGDL